MNSLGTALPGLVPIFVSAGGVNALAGDLFLINFMNYFILTEFVMTYCQSCLQPGCDLSFNFVNCTQATSMCVI